MSHAIWHVNAQLEELEGIVPQKIEPPEPKPQQEEEEEEEEQVPLTCCSICLIACSYADLRSRLYITLAAILSAFFC